MGSDEVMEDIDRWLDEEEGDTGEDNLHELYGDEGGSGSDSDESDVDEDKEANLEEEVPIMRKVYKKKKLTKKRNVNSIGKKNTRYGLNNIQKSLLLWWL